MENVMDKMLGKVTCNHGGWPSYLLPRLASRDWYFPLVAMESNTSELHAGTMVRAQWLTCHRCTVYLRLVSMKIVSF